MFTGLIEETGTISGYKDDRGRRLIDIRCQKVLSGLDIGDSVAVDGVCLTVVQIDSVSFTAEIMNETLQKTTAASWRIQRIVNLERSMQASARFDGHIVQGHVDTTTRLRDRTATSGTLYLRFDLPPEATHLVVPQGSISINGVSLTIAQLTTGDFSVALISHTTGETNLGDLKPGDTVNLEFDILGKYVARMLGQGAAGLSLTRMRELGY